MIGLAMNEKFINKAITNPLWEQLRVELSPDLFSELCWWINNGENYCKTSAPKEIATLLKRLKLI
jgi:hypothetical protein